MRVFGTVDTFIEGPARNQRLGRLVANARFVEALIRHGHFDAYHLFCPSVSHMRALERALIEEMPEVVKARRIMLSTQLLLHEHLRRHQYSAFHVGGWGLYLPRLAYLRATIGARPFPLTGVTHSLHTPDLFLKARELVQAPFTEGDAVVCTSEAGRLVMTKHCAEARRRLVDEGQPVGPSPPRLATIPLGVDDRCFALPERAASRASLDLAPESVVALYLGRVSAHTKADLPPLLGVFARMLQRRPEAGHAVLVIAGGAEAGSAAALEETRRELGLGERVRILRDVSDQTKYQLLAAADLFVSPVDNPQETFGLSIVEAMAAGLPVVASDFDGYRDLVVDGQTGFLIPTCGGRLPPFVTDLLGILDPNMVGFLLAQSVAVDTGVLGHRLEQLFTDAPLRARLGENGRRRARERYAWPVVIAQYEALWAELCARSRPVPPGPGDPHVGDLQALFSHYPTALLDDTDELRLTDLARAVVAGSAPPPALYEDLVPLMEARTVPHLLGQLGGGARSLRDCAATAERELGVPAPWVRVAVIWLIKQGLLERAATAQVRSPSDR
jgi:glycosyltransferase involved in cell wall biosynthesis